MAEKVRELVEKYQAREDYPPAVYTEGGGNHRQPGSGYELN